MKEFPLKKIALDNGETLAWRQAGISGPVLLLLHGNMSSSIHFDTVMEALENEFRIYAVDLRGFGDSSYNSPVDSLKDFAEDIALFLQGQGLIADAALGWSTGGGVALELAANHPELVKRLILVESVGLTGYPMYKKGADGQPIVSERITTREEVAADPVQVVPILQAYASGNTELLKAVWNMLIYTRAQPEEQRYERYLQAMLQQRNLVDVNYSLLHFNMTHASNGVSEGSGRLDNIEVPVLVIQGEEDLVVPRAFGEQTAQLLGERATLQLLPDIGHSPFTDDLEQVLKLVREFVPLD